MIEKVNPSHPDKVADRIAGAIVDYCYKVKENPKVAVEVLIGHGECNIIVESDVYIVREVVREIVDRICNTTCDEMRLNFSLNKQDEHLAKNQSDKIRCGDNGIFKGVPLTSNEILISCLARRIYDKYTYDGKYILTDDKFIICQSNASSEELHKEYDGLGGRNVIVNPLGDWTGGTNVDSGATNRKLGSDMAQSVTGGGLHGKDLSKADVSVNIYAFKKAQKTGKVVELCCAIGDTEIDGKPYKEIVEEAREYINKIGGFEKFAEWGLY